ncbi:predicted protein [Streptomyces viridochromogenes DSM 40736]|uniref:Predicted protein n=1 Tax=Streptomyces viridochromogenes (strain DSM 40736 / JCM 4977 / BCRC 1201 / Tue 494) TaxID=591159 RepID=D9X767_STRVT|nr:predicted protein [Streptomyces viridochromogenes DSM 40736]
MQNLDDRLANRRETLKVAGQGRVASFERAAGSIAIGRARQTHERPPLESPLE